MAITVTLEGSDEELVLAILESGEHASALSVVQAGLRLTANKTETLRAFWVSIDAAIAEADAGNVYELDEVFDEFEARYDGLAKPKDAA